MSEQKIIFDLDDTLIHCNKYFEKTIHQFANLLAHWFQPHILHYAEIREVQHQLDLKAVKQSGFRREHFPQSMIDTYHHFARRTGRQIVRPEIKRLWELGESVYHQDFEAYPHMFETLETLQKKGHELHLYTGGEHDIQYRKVEKMGLHSFFEDRIYVAKKKATPFLESLLNEYAFDRARTWMVGNSLRTDILPAFQTGIHAIFIPAEIEWEYNQIEIDIPPGGAFFEVSGLQHVPPVIDQFLSLKETP
jgi:putative hydrolase of the HAD superfamily